MNLSQHMEGDTLATRAISGFALSIGTGLALETIVRPTQDVYDITREAPRHVSPQRYSEFWINLTTLFRNIAQALSKTGFVASSEAEFKDTLLQEMGVIDSLFQNEGVNACRPRYYYTDHTKLRNRLPEQIKFRENKTDIQKAYHAKMEKTLKLLEKETEVAQRFDEEIRVSGHPTGLILTHIPYDLLSYRNFSKLSLLESHTGLVKEKNRWNGKYYPVGVEDLSHLPFNRRLLLVFGDRVLFQPGIIQLRRQIIDIGRERNWNALTSDEKVMMDLSLSIKEPFVLAFLRSL